MTLKSILIVICEFFINMILILTTKKRQEYLKMRNGFVKTQAQFRMIRERRRFKMVKIYIKFSVLEK